ncbi:MAG: hypothetical protein AB8G11_01125 [Saprospiraceae bacterium]
MKSPITKIMIEENKIKLFDAYRNSELSDAEREAFEQRLEKEAVFKLEYEEYLGIVSGIRQFERERLKAFLEEETEQEALEAKVLQMRTFSPFAWVKYAAAIVLLLCMFPLVNYFTFESRMVSEHSLELIDDNTMGEVEEDIRLKFYEAIELKKAGKTNEAIANFKSIKSNDVNIYFLAQYELALIEVEQKKVDDAKTRLDKLIQRKENHFVKAKAELLLKDLKGTKFL